MAVRKNIPNAILEDVNLIFLNFRGLPDKYHRDGGYRSFSVVLDQKTAKAMERDGWNIKWPKPRPNAEEGEVLDPHIAVHARFDFKPPLIYMITSNNPTPPPLSEDLVGMLDSVDIVKVDLIINARQYDKDDNSIGVKAYLKSMYVTIEEDPLAKKYAINSNRSHANQDDE